MNNHVEIRVMVPREMKDEMQRYLTKHGIKQAVFVRQAIERMLKQAPDKNVDTSLPP